MSDLIKMRVETEEEMLKTLKEGRQEKGDEFENLLTSHINDLRVQDVAATRAGGTVKKSDVELTTPLGSSYIEAKAAFSANMFSKRVSFLHGKWFTSDALKAKVSSSEEVEDSYILISLLSSRSVMNQVSSFLAELNSFLRTKEGRAVLAKYGKGMQIPTSVKDLTLAGNKKYLNVKGNIHPIIMKAFLGYRGNTYMVDMKVDSISKLVDDYYSTKGEGVSYIEFGGGGLYSISGGKDLFGIPDIPPLTSVGGTNSRIKMRIVLRPHHPQKISGNPVALADWQAKTVNEGHWGYEIIPEIKLGSGVIPSPYSLLSIKSECDPVKEAVDWNKSASAKENPILTAFICRREDEKTKKRKSMLKKWHGDKTKKPQRFLGPTRPGSVKGPK